MTNLHTSVDLRKDKFSGGKEMSIKKYPSITVADIRKIEQKYDLRLPQDYIDHLLKYNGGHVDSEDDTGIYMECFDDEIHVDVLFGINTGHKNTNIETWMDNKIIGSDVPDKTIIIGDTYEHGFIVLVCAGDDSGVYYWDHSYNYECSDAEGNVYLLANTFSQLIASLI